MAQGIRSLFRGRDDDTDGVVQHTVGNAVVFHAENSISPEAQSLALSVVADSDNDIVVLDLGEGMPINSWESMAGMLPRRRRGIRLMACGRQHNAAAMAGQWLAQRLNRTVIAPDGDLVRGSAGGLFVHSVSGSGWVRFRPGKPPAWESKRYPAPSWDRAVTDNKASSSVAEAEPMPGGVWIHDTRDPDTLAEHRARLIADVPCQPERMTVLLGCPGTPPLSLDDVVRFWRGLDADARKLVRFVKYGEVRLPEGETLGQALADLLATDVTCYTGVPVGSPANFELRSVRVDGSLGWAPFALELLYTPRAHPNSRPRRPVVAGHRAPLSGTEEISPRLYWYAPDVVLEVVQSGLWIRGVEEPGNAEKVRGVPLDTENGRLIFDDSAEARTERMRDLAADLAARIEGPPVGPLTPASNLAPEVKRGGRAGGAITAGPPPAELLASPTIAVSLAEIRAAVAARTSETAPSAPSAPGSLSGRAVLPIEPPAPSASEPVSARAVMPVRAVVPAPVSAPSAPAAAPEPAPAPAPATSAPQASAPSIPPRSGAVSTPRPRLVDLPAVESPAFVPLPAHPAPVPAATELPDAVPAAVEPPAAEPLTAASPVEVPQPSAPESSAPEPPAPESVAPPVEFMVTVADVEIPAFEPVRAVAGPAVETEPEPVEPAPAPEPDAVRPPPRDDAVWPQPVPDVSAVALLPERPLDDERAWLRRTLSREFDTMASSVARIMSEHPAMQGSSLSGADLLADAVAARLFLTPRGSGVDTGLRSGRKGPHVPFARCAVSGLSRMPSFRGTTIFRMSPVELEWQLYREARVFVDWGFVTALTQPCAAQEGDTDVLLWSMTGRRTALLEPDGDERVDDRIVYLPGTSFKVLDLREPSADARGAILIRELSTNEIDAEGRIDPDRKSLDELAITALDRSLDRWAGEQGRRRIGPAARARFDVLPGLDRRR